MLLFLLLTITNIFFVFTNFTINFRFHKRTRHVEIIPHSKSLIQGNYYTSLIKLNLEYLIYGIILSLIILLVKFLFIVYGYYFVSYYYFKHSFFLAVFTILNHGFSATFYSLFLIFYYKMLKDCYFTLDKNKFKNLIYLCGLFLGFFFTFFLVIASIGISVGMLMELIYSWKTSEYAFFSFLFYKREKSILRKFSTIKEPSEPFELVISIVEEFFLLKKKWECMQIIPMSECESLSTKRYNIAKI